MLFLVRSSQSTSVPSSRPRKLGTREGANPGTSFLGLTRRKRESSSSPKTLPISCRAIFARGGDDRYRDIADDSENNLTSEKANGEEVQRATAPLDETARARLWQEVSGCVSVESTTSDTAELADLIDSFYNEEEIDERKGNSGMGSEKGGYLTRRSLDSVLAESEADMVAHRIRVAAERGLAQSRRQETASKGLCKSSWERAERIQAGTHDYIDVIDRGGGTRYILEIDLAAEFEIARPTQDYTALLRALPSVFVGRPGALESIVSLMCVAMEESIRSSGMHLPPWRRKEYVRAKWFSSYGRNSAAGEEADRGAASRSGTTTTKPCRIELRCREVKVREGMLAEEFRGTLNGYGF